MIARAPLAPDGLIALAALIQKHGPQAGLGDALQAALHALPPIDDPAFALATVVSRRRHPAPAGRPHADGPVRAARFLRRLGRRSRVLQAPHTPPVPRTAEGLKAALAASPDPAVRRDLVALAPLSWRAPS
jgi:hypothetical protein